MAHLNMDEAKTDKEKRRAILKRQMMNAHRVKVTFRILPRDLKKLKKKLAENGVYMNDFLNDIILKYIEIEE